MGIFWAPISTAAPTHVLCIDLSKLFVALVIGGHTGVNVGTSGLAPGHESDSCVGPGPCALCAALKENPSDTVFLSICLLGWRVPHMHPDAPLMRPEGTVATTQPGTSQPGTMDRPLD